MSSAHLSNLQTSPAMSPPAVPAEAPPPSASSSAILPPAASSSWRVRSSQDLAAGLLIAAIGAGALWIGRDWQQGTLASVQSGFFPRVLGIALVLFGTVIAGRGLLLPGAALPGWAWRPLAGVTVAVLGFALSLEWLGLVPAILVLVALGNLAGQPLRPLPLAVLGTALAGGCVAIFVGGLGLPFRVWP